MDIKELCVLLFSWVVVILPFAAPQFNEGDQTSPTKINSSGMSSWVSYVSTCLDSTPNFSGTYLQDSRIVSKMNQRSTIEGPSMTCFPRVSRNIRENGTHGVYPIRGRMRATLCLLSQHLVLPIQIWKNCFIFACVGGIRMLHVWVLAQFRGRHQTSWN